MKIEMFLMNLLISSELKMKKKVVYFLFAIICFVTSIHFIFYSYADTSYKGWKQSDSRWGNLPLGKSDCTMSSSGCVVTSISILAVHSGNAEEKNFNPGVLCKFLNNNGGFTSTGNLYWNKVSLCLPNFQYDGKESISGYTTSQKISYISWLLEKGYSLLASVKYGGHYVAIDKVENGIVYMMDPGKNTCNDLFNTYSAAGINDIVKFKTVSTSTEPYKEGLYFINVPVLNLRSEATTNSTVLTTLKDKTNIEVTEVIGLWGKTQYLDFEGWVYLPYCEFISYNSTEPTPETTPEQSPDLPSASYQSGKYITKTSINLRKSSSTNSNILTVIEINTPLIIEKTDKEWGLCNYNGYTGWINLSYAEKYEDTIDHIYVASLPTKIEYALNETFDKSGLIIKGVYSLKDEFEINNYKIENFSSSSEGVKTVIISAYGKTCVFNVAILKKAPLFTDIEDHWAKIYIDYASRLGIFKGTDETKFSPETNLTRGMLVSAVGRLMNINAEQYKNTFSFSDVNINEYYAPYIAWAKENKLVSGRNASEFFPDDSISRQEMAVFFTNLIKKYFDTDIVANNPCKFNDKNEIAEWALEAVCIMNETSLINGKGNNFFDPLSSFTRAEASTLITKLINKYFLTK